MLKKLNNKGFTLIEMLVVIAIIAVLVSIAIPVVTGSTDKAAAASNAANLRSIQAEVSTLYLSSSREDLTDTDGVKQGIYTIKVTAGSGTTADTIEIQVADDATTGAKVPTFKQISGMDASKDVEVEYKGNQFVATVGGKGVNDFATFAETGKFPGTTDGE